MAITKCLIGVQSCEPVHLRREQLRQCGRTSEAMVPGEEKQESDMERDYQIEELTDEQLSEVSGGGLILERLSVVLGIAITGGIAAGIMSCDTGTLNGLRH
jgi:hypothetical protein